MPLSKAAHASGIASSNRTSIEEICSMLRRAGVPNQVHWQSLILYLRTLSEYHFLSEQQKLEIQAMYAAKSKGKNQVCILDDRRN